MNDWKGSIYLNFKYEKRPFYQHQGNSCLWTAGSIREQAAFLSYLVDRTRENGGPIPSSVCRTGLLRNNLFSNSCCHGSWLITYRGEKPIFLCLHCVYWKTMHSKFSVFIFFQNFSQPIFIESLLYHRKKINFLCENYFSSPEPRKIVLYYFN